MVGNGWDLLVNSRNITGKLSWTTQLNVNLNRDKIKQYYLADKAGINFINGGSVAGVEGRSVFGTYAFRSAGLDPLTGDPRGYLDGEVSKDYAAITGTGTDVSDLKYFGPTLPTATLSIGNHLQWKQLSLDIRITGKFGHWFRRPSIKYSSLFNDRAGHSDFSLRWQQPGDENHTTVPSMIYPNNSQRDIFYQYSETLVSKADHIRLQYITLGYQLRKPDLQVYANFNNLGLIWKANHYGIDPEYNNGLPPSVTMALGVRASF
jgi:TonB-dependent starch-binding outer membrane protein SusC